MATAPHTLLLQLALPLISTFILTIFNTLSQLDVADQTPNLSAVYRCSKQQRPMQLEVMLRLQALSAAKRLMASAGGWQ